MKKNLHPTMIAIAILSITFGACKEKEKEKEKTIHVENVTLNKINALLHVGDTLTLSAIVSPLDATNKTVNWISSNTTVATADSNVITAKYPGEAVITVTTKDGNKTANCIVSVTMPSVADCNGNIPGFGTSLGTVNFATEQEWVVNSQVWSDVVTATNCNKTTYSGGQINNFNADCRSNHPDYPGSLFSWCAMVRFGDILCPEPWRIPTNEDFIKLDITLGGTGNEFRRGDTITRDRYLNYWGGVYAGSYDQYFFQILTGQGLGGVYWGFAGFSPYSHGGWVLAFNHLGNIDLSDGIHKTRGVSIRCVRDGNEP